MIEKKSRSRKPTAKKDYAQNFIDAFQERHKPVSQEYINKIAEEMLKWVEKSSSFIIGEFMTSLPHTRTQVYDWAKMHPVLANAIELTKAKLAIRREQRAAEDPKYALVYQKGLAVYDYDYRDSMEYLEAMRARYRNDNNKSEGPQIIVIDKMPDTAIVKPRESFETEGE